MKFNICISVEEETLLRVRESVRSGRFRNRSHAFEQAVLDALAREGSR